MDAPVLPDLLNQSPHERIGGVTADGAYDTRKCHDASSFTQDQPHKLFAYRGS